MRWTRRVAAPCVCFAPWAALASCRPLPQQLLPVSAAGGGRRRCKQGAARPFQPQRGWAPYKKASCFAKTGCGAQRPLRALSGTRVLLTAAPTAPPCIRRWRRSSPLHFFLASPIDRPLSRCGGSSPQGSGCALSVTFGDTLSPFCRCATSSPDRGKSFKGRGKKRSLHGLGSPFGRAGAKRLRGLVLPQAATDAK